MSGPSDASDSERFLASLFCGSLSDFVARRKALIDEARRAGSKSAVKALRETKKPSQAAWLLNQLAADAPDRLRAYVDVIDAQKEALTTGQGAATSRSLAEQERALIAELRGLASDRLREEGVGKPGPHLERLSTALRECALDPVSREQMFASRLVQDPAPTDGLELLGALAAALPTSARPRPSPKPAAIPAKPASASPRAPAAEPKAPPPPSRAELEAARARLAAAEREERNADRAAREARAAAEATSRLAQQRIEEEKRASSAVQAAEEALEHARARLERVAGDAHAAAATHETAEANASSAEEARELAKRKLEAARARVSELT